MSSNARNFASIIMARRGEIKLQFWWVINASSYLQLTAEPVIFHHNLLLIPGNCDKY